MKHAGRIGIGIRIEAPSNLLAGRAETLNPSVGLPRVAKKLVLPLDCKPIRDVGIVYAL